MSLFCCSSIQPFRPQILSHEPKFRSFSSWASYPKEASRTTIDHDTLLAAMQQSGTFVIQLVRQINYGALESTRYFLATSGTGLAEQQESFVEIQEADLVTANYKKLNAYKNFRCGGHDRFFEVNVYQKDPLNTHHWRTNVARPGSEIDL